MEAQKNASLLQEYHGLYELQRKRLEKNIESLVDEREMWIKAAYSVALKVNIPLQELSVLAVFNTIKKTNLDNRGKQAGYCETTQSCREIVDKIGQTLFDFDKRQGHQRPQRNKQAGRKLARNNKRGAPQSHHKRK